MPVRPRVRIKSNDIVSQEVSEIILQGRNDLYPAILHDRIILGAIEVEQIGLCRGGSGNFVNQAK